MKFDFVKEEKYSGKIKLLSLKKMALGLTQRCYDIEISELIDPLLIIAKQHNLNVKVAERMVCGEKQVFFEYKNEDIVKAIHILNVSTVLN